MKYVYYICSIIIKQNNTMKQIKNNLVGIITTVVFILAIPATIVAVVNTKPTVKAPAGYVKALNGNLYHKVK